MTFEVALLLSLMFTITLAYSFPRFEYNFKTIKEYRTFTQNSTLDLETPPVICMISSIPRNIYVVKRVWPEYPDSVKDPELVVVRIELNTDGEVRRTELLKSSPSIDKYVLAAAQKWNFNGSGDMAGVTVVIPFNFKN